MIGPRSSLLVRAARARSIAWRASEVVTSGGRTFRWSEPLWAWSQDGHAAVASVWTSARSEGAKQSPTSDLQRSAWKQENGASSKENKGNVMDWENPVPHPTYDLNEITDVEQTHCDAKELHDRVALFAVKMLRRGFDFASRYRGPGGAMMETDWLNRCLFLETIAGVPGMVAGMTRHLHSIRAMKRDYGWIHTLLAEAENERMHLLIFLNLKQPGWFFRAMVLGAQGVFFNLFFLSYLVSPRTCHRFVGYLEEEAVKTYTGLLQDIQDDHLPVWKQQEAPQIAKRYYRLPNAATIRDMVKCIRADEAHHRDVNHTFAGLDQKHGVNPFIPRGSKEH